jgi:hypothetical protein
MIPIGYMAKRVGKPSGWLGRADIVDVYSVGDCVNDNFADYTNFWKHNAYWFFDSPQVIQALAKEQSLDLTCALLFYYEAFEREFSGEKSLEKDFSRKAWRPVPAVPDDFGIPMNVVQPAEKRLEGYDVITVWVENSPVPEHSPLSCNGFAEEIPTNVHCLFDTFELAESSINRGEFEGGEPGALRIIAVYSVDWPSDK